MGIVRLALNQVSVDNAMQCRHHMDEDTIADYTAAYKDGQKLPPPVVFNDGKTRWLADGFHRYPSAKKAGLKHMQFDERKGTRRDALLYAVGANATNGLRRTNEDKRRAVMVLLKDVEWQKWPAREIAKRAGVGHAMVNEIRKAIAPEQIHRKPAQAAESTKPAAKVNDTPKKSASIPAKQDDDVVFDPTETPAQQSPITPAPFLGDPQKTPEETTTVLSKAWEAHAPTRDIVSAITGMIKAWEKLGQDLHPFTSEQSVTAHLKNAISEIRTGQPFAFCPYCLGVESPIQCQACRGNGWVTKTIFENAPQEMREITKTLNKD